MIFSAVLLGLVILAALAAIIGGLWVLAKQQVVVDQEGSVSYISLPFFGKLRTNYPSLVAIMLGVALAWSVQSRIQLVITAKQVPLTASISLEGIPPTNHVFVSAVPQRYMRAANQSKVITLEVDEPGPYTVIAFTVAGATKEGYPIYTLAQGPAVRLEPSGFEFNGILTSTKLTEALND